MRLLVTGGAGFVGANLIRYVLQTTRSVEVINLDALTYAGHLGSLIDVEDDHRYRFVQGDVRDTGLIGRLVADVDAVVHCAAESHVDRSIERPQAFLDTNVTGSGIVFDACRRGGIDRLLLMSTHEVYGPIEAPRAAVESDPLRPDSPHGTSKAAADLLARSYGVTYGYPITVARSTTSYGAFQYPEKLLPLFITNLIDGERLPVYGDGSHVRDWLHVEDCCAAMWSALTDGVAGEVYNVGARAEVTNLDLTLRLLEVFGAEDGVIDHVEDRPGHAQRYAVDTAAIRALGWSPRIGLEDGMSRTVAWYRANEWWWRPLKNAGASVRRGRLVAL